MSQVTVDKLRPAARVRGGLAALDRIRLRDLNAGRGEAAAGPPRRVALPSWFTSACLHGLVLAAVLFGMRRWDGFGRRGEAETDSRLTGLVTQLDGDSGTDAPPGEIGLSVTGEEPLLPATELPPSDPAAEDLPPVDLPELPGGDLPAVEGPGVGAPRFSPPASATASAGGGTSEGPAAPAGLARGETSFLGIRDSGATFAYVIDTSGSMEDNDAIQVAKAELMASLAALRPGQQFQVIFYNERPIPIRLPGRAPEKLFDATDLNKTLARQVIAATRANLGTNHLLALREALGIAPDVIFFLTDADDPALTAKDLDEVRKANTGGTRIHAIEFGKGAKLEGSRSLERLADQNHGAYQYRDVTRFRR